MVCFLTVTEVCEIQLCCATELLKCITLPFETKQIKFAPDDIYCDVWGTPLFLYSNLKTSKHSLKEDGIILST